MFASTLARLATGLHCPVGESLLDGCLCAACGCELRAGQEASRLSVGNNSFTDFQYLASRSGFTCLDCAVFFREPAMKAVQGYVLSAEGRWRLVKDAHREWFYRNPPAPPFVALLSDSKSALTTQHLVWRAPITLDVDLLRVQFGRTTLTIDRPIMLEAVAWCEEAVELANGAGLQIKARHPFISLDRSLSSLFHGCIRNEVYLVSRKIPRLKKLIDRLLLLSEGELWGLSVLAKKKPEAPLEEFYPPQIKSEEDDDV